MSTRLRADLEARIQGWININCEKGDWEGLDVWVHAEMAEDMALAAYTVFMACVKSQAEREQ